MNIITLYNNIRKLYNMFGPGITWQPVSQIDHHIQVENLIRFSCSGNFLLTTQFASYVLPGD